MGINIGSNLIIDKSRIGKLKCQFPLSLKHALDPSNPNGVILVQQLCWREANRESWLVLPETGCCCPVYCGEISLTSGVGENWGETLAA